LLRRTFAFALVPRNRPQRFDREKLDDTSPHRRPARVFEPSVRISGARDLASEQLPIRRLCSRPRKTRAARLPA
jgi:hypothetical protein